MFLFLLQLVIFGLCFGVFKDRGNFRNPIELSLVTMFLSLTAHERHTIYIAIFQNTHSKLAQTSASHYHNTILIGDLFCCDSLANFTFYRNRYLYKQYISENSRAPPKRHHGFKVARRVYDTFK